MLAFDVPTSRFLLDGIAIGRGTREADVEGRLDGRLSDLPGHRDHRRFDGRSGDLTVFLGFRGGLLDDGYFLAALPGGGSWDRIEEYEGWRRQRHEAIMRALFGALRFESRDLVVDLVREPRNLTEELRFVVPR